MKIRKVDGCIEFDNGDVILSDHTPDCCEYNYADFDQVEKVALDTEFTYPITIEACEYGFRFGNPPQKMFFVPCYTEQNGYYSGDVEVLYCKRGGEILRKVITEGEWRKR